MIIIGLSNSHVLAKEVARKLNIPYVNVNPRFDTDGEMHINFGCDVKGKKVFLFQSFYPNQNLSLVEVLFSSSLARDLGARSVNLVAPYLSYQREDLRKEKFDCVSVKILGEILSNFVDSLLCVEPHLKDLSKYFTIPVHSVNCSELIKHYVKNNYNGAVVVGPDENARPLVMGLGSKNIILKKKKKDLDVKFEKGFNLKNKNALIIDDMVVTGTTLIGCLNYLGLKKADFVVIHPVMKNNVLEKLKEYGKVISCNTIENESNVLDVSGLIAGRIKDEWCS